jgi:hypothetical protein
MMKTVKNLLPILFALALGYWLILPVQAQDQNQVGLIVQSDDSSISTYCISFTGDSITGYEVLEKSGLNIAASFDSMGAAVCKIGEIGCSIDNCFCQSPPDYWSYWHLSGNQWTYSQLGASSYQVQTGEVEGWRWGGGNPPTAIYSFNEICAPATETSTATPTETSTPTLLPTTMQPTETSNLAADAGSDKESTPFTIYFDTSSSGKITPSPTLSSLATSVDLEIATPGVTVEEKAVSPTVQIKNTEPPILTPTQKIKATSLRATRQAKKTQESLQKTSENISTQSIEISPSPTTIPEITATVDSGMTKFILVLLVLAVLTALGTWVLKKRG